MTDGPQTPQGKRSRGPLVAMFVMMVLVVGVLVYLLIPLPQVILPGNTTTTRSFSTISVGPNNPHIHYTVIAAAGGGTQTTAYTGLLPLIVSFTAQSDGTAPFTYHWDFGDGTDSTSGFVDHTFLTNCAYDIHLDVRDVRGRTTSKDVILATFSSQSSSNSSLLCPKVGTAGITDTIIEGGYATPNSHQQISVDGNVARNTVVWADGHWAEDISDAFVPKPNGSTYSIVVSPLGRIRTFTTLEGLSVSPASAVPGDLIRVIGMSYPPTTLVSLSLGGVGLGQAQSDESGSFNATFVVPSAPPLTAAGLYLVTSEPSAMGAQASLIVSRNTGSIISTNSDIFPWVILAAAVILVVLLTVFLRRLRRRPKSVSRQPGVGRVESDEL